MKSLLPLLLLAVLTAPVQANETVAPFKPDPKKGEALATVCLACHTADGSRGTPTFPILQGQHPEYLTKQLVEFKSGARNNAVMKGFASALSEEDMKNLSAFYASKEAKPGFAKDKALVSLGEQIYRGGIAAKKVPACAGCHGATGAGIPSQYPRLSGQHAEYTESQLTAFHGGTRANNASMMTIASRLSERERKALADYVAGLH
jgi:cytochrome c553